MLSRSLRTWVPLLVILCGTDGFIIPSRVSVSSTSALYSSNSKKKVFIDGEAGTTGLQVRERLSARSDIEILTLADTDRKDVECRRAAINEADAVILCLPDAASIEANDLLEDSNKRTVIIDASTAFRTDDTWTYGFPELSQKQRENISNSKKISNPGCYPTGFIALTRPLIDANIIPKSTPLTVNAISGYSGGGKQLMELYESDDEDIEPWGAYAFSLTHKHLPEMKKYSGLDKIPIFQPQVANFAQGMVVSVPLHYEWLHTDGDTNASMGSRIHSTLTDYYADSEFITVMPKGESQNSAMLERGAFLRPDSLKDTNKMQLFVFDNDDSGMALLCARLDNLGKGASGAAVQNMNIALGLDESAGL